MADVICGTAIKLFIQSVFMGVKHLDQLRCELFKFLAILLLAVANKKKTVI